MTQSGSRIERAEQYGLVLLGEEERALLAADPVDVAPRLIGLVVVSTDGNGVETGGRIVEVEAYRGGEDPASHAFRGETARNRTMFGSPGLLYVYFTYGMHHCCNVVCDDEGVAGAVLLRALEPVLGLALMGARRSLRRVGPPLTRDLCSGPGKLCQALGIDRADDGLDLLSGPSRIRLARSETLEAPRRIATSARIGIADHLLTAGEPWRFYEEANNHVSTGRPVRAQAHAPLR